MAAFFAFGGTPVDVEIKLQGEDDRRQVEVKGEKDKKDMCPVYYDGESVIGTVCHISIERLAPSQGAALSFGQLTLR
jgi:vacuolar protein sorting-associated protein 26